MAGFKLLPLGNPTASIENYNQACIPLIKNITVNWFVLQSTLTKWDKGDNINIDINQIIQLKKEASTAAELVIKLLHRHKLYN